jgi:hypothetical protein
MLQVVQPGQPASPQMSLGLHSTQAVVQMMQQHFNQTESLGELKFLIEPKLDGED